MIASFKQTLFFFLNNLPFLLFVPQEKIFDLGSAETLWRERTDLVKKYGFTSAQSTVLAKVKNNTRQLIKHNRKIRRVNSHSIDRNSAQFFVFNWNTLVYGQKFAAVESFCFWRRQRLRSQSLVYLIVVESVVIVYVITAV